MNSKMIKKKQKKKKKLKYFLAAVFICLWPIRIAEEWTFWGTLLGDWQNGQSRNWTADIPEATLISTTRMTWAFSGNKLIFLPNFQWRGGIEFSWTMTKSPTFMTVSTWSLNQRDISSERYSLEHHIQNCFLRWRRRPYLEDKLTFWLVVRIFFGISIKWFWSNDYVLCLLNRPPTRRMLSESKNTFNGKNLLVGFTHLFFLNCLISLENSATCIILTIFRFA